MSLRQPKNESNSRERLAIVRESVMRSEAWRNASLAARSVYFALALHADKHGKNARPSVGTLATLAGLQRRHVFNKITELERAGLVTVDRSKSGLRKPNIYTLTGVPQCISTVEHLHHDASTSASRRTSAGVPQCHLTPPYNTNGTQKKSARRSAAASVSAADIESIYRAYPRKEAKGKAVKAIAKAIDRIAAGGDRPDGHEGAWPPADVVSWLRERVDTYAAARHGQEKRFTPHPATWFNELRYTTNPAEWSLSDDRASNTKPGRVRPRPDDDWDAGGIKLPPPEQ